GKSFVPRELLDGDFPTEDPAELARILHVQLLRLRSHAAALDLSVGRGVASLVEGKRFRQLGHSRLKDWVPARYGFSWGTASDLIALADGLPGLPHAHAAFLAGTLSRSKACVLVGAATPENERGWLGYAAKNGVRGLKRRVAEWNAG